MTVDPVLVLYSGGSDARQCAAGAAGRLEQERIEVLTGDLSAYPACNLLARSWLLLCIEPAGKESPEPLLDLIDFLEPLGSTDLDQLKFGLLAAGGSPIGENGIATRLDTLFKSRGAIRLAPLMRCESCSCDRLHVWIESIAIVISLRIELGLADRGGTDCRTPPGARQGDSVRLGPPPAVVPTG